MLEQRNNNSNQICSTVPYELKILIRTIVNSIYGFECYLLIENLMIYSCLRDEELADLLHLDLKLVRNNLLYLKKKNF